MNGMCRVESDNSVDADEPIMKHLMEGGVTILKQLERKKQVRINYKTFLIGNWEYCYIYTRIGR